VTSSRSLVPSDETRADAGALDGSGTARHQCVQLLDRFQLESGEVLRNVRQAYYLDGTLNAQRNNMVVVFHALTGSADAVGDWWSDVAGAGRAIDTGQYAVLCTNLLGSCYGTTGPSDPSRLPFPAVTTRDMARLVGQLVESLHVSSVALAIGGSLGGMVALEFAATFPALARSVVVLAAPAEHPSSAVAWSHLQRRAIAIGGDEGLELARMIAMMTYRTAGELHERFGRQRADDGSFEVSQYLSRHGEKLRARFDVQSYLTLLDAMDTHDVGRARDGVGAALRNVKSRIIGVGIPGDLLYDPRDVRRWTDAANAEYREVHSLNGHDGFLTEGVQVSSLVRDVLGAGSESASRSTQPRPATHTTGDVTADVVILGYGRIGRELATQLGSVIGPYQARVVAVIDRTGYVFNAHGIPPAELADLAHAKEGGVGLSRSPHGHQGTAAEALVHVHRHTPSRPILVDVTAGDTGSELEAALQAGMDIVLANKRPLAEARGVSGGLAQSAARHGRRMLHEATVGAGLPIIDTIGKLQESGDEVLGIEGCPSGTLGYLFGELGHGTSFSTALRTAMTLGYTEPDPREDLSGMDVARKALILGRLIGFEGDLDQVDVESLVPIELRAIGAEQFLARLPELDSLWRARVDDAAVSGRVLRYRATVSPTSVRVGLTAVDSSSPLATLTGTDNQFAISTRRYHDHPIVITGPGAGVGVTAAGVLNDVLKLARSR
jgi:homoserine O-acetyltransferase